LLHLGVVGRDRVPLPVSKMQPDLIKRDLPQPGSKHASLLAKLIKMTENRSENLLDGIRGIAVLQATRSAPAIDDRPIQRAKPFPSRRV
jgi:hypothetical protein